jgi:hypothetical protein
MINTIGIRQLATRHTTTPRSKVATRRLPAGAPVAVPTINREVFCIHIYIYAFMY